MMYEELVKRLRSAANPKREFDNELFLEDIAADAIEDLQKQLQKSEVDNINLTGWLAEEHAKHLWIPVTERLPEFEGAVLCMRKSNVFGVRPYQEILYVDEFGFKNFDDIYLADGVVTHWMPLPEPPMEE